MTDCTSSGSHAQYSDTDYSNAMFVCGFFFHMIHDLEEKIDKSPVVPLSRSYLVASFYVPLSYLFPSKAFGDAFLDCIKTRLSVYSPESFYLFCRISVELQKNHISQFSESRIDFVQFLTLSAAYDITLDEWLDSYSDLFRFTTASICTVLKESISSTPANHSRKPNKKNLVALLLLPISVVLLVIVFILFFSQRNTPSIPTPSSPPSVDAESSAQPNSAVSFAATDPVQSPDTIDIPLSEIDLKYVWVTPSGSRYHLRNCPKIKDSDELIRKPRGQGVYSDYNPCRVCDPDKVDWENAVFSGNDSSAQTTDHESPVPLSLPRNGRHYPTYDFSNSTFSSICVHAPTTSNCFVIVKRAGKDIILDRFFVRANETVDTFLPVGELDVFFAFGDDWYGTDLLFGDSTTCQVDRDLDISDAYGYEYTLYPVVDGNLTMPSVSMEEMLAG